MFKNQSIKSFFNTSALQNANTTKKDETETILKKKEENSEETKTTTTTTTIAPAKTNTPQKRQRKISSSSSEAASPPKSASKEKTKAKKLTKKIESDEDDDNGVIEEKENVKEEAKATKGKSKKSPKKSAKKASVAEKITKMESESDESPAKSTDAKKRKLVLESSSSESEAEADKSTKKSPAAKKETKKETKAKEPKAKEAKKAAPKKETKAKKESPVKEKETKSEPKEEVKETEVVEVKEEPKAVKEEESKAAPIKEEKVVEKKEIKLIDKPGKEETNLISKSTSNFFGGKKAEKMNLSAASDTQSSKGSYCPSKENYHPIDDACWSKNEPVPYKALAQTLYCMEQTTKRLELLSIVCNYFRSVLLLTPKDLIPSIYILTNKVAPDYDGLELGIGDTVLFKALAEATGSTLAKLKSDFQAKGDIGLVAESNRCNQRLIFTPKKLSISAVFNKLKEIASISGNSSQSKKCDFIKGLLVSCDAVEARYLMRSLAGKMRTGLGELSILSALAHACAITPPPKSPEDPIVIDYFAKMRKNDQIDEIKKKLDEAATLLKQAYHQCPNYDRVINAIISYGMDKLEEHCKVTPGVPLKPMLAYPTKGVQEVLNRFENIQFTCEYKYDGERAQIHILEDGSIQVFSRNSENNTSKYPDVIETLQEILKLKKKGADKKKEGEEETATSEPEHKVSTAILDAEVVAYDSENKVILPFQVLSTRKRKDASSADIKIKVCLFAFDLLYLNGESIIEKPFRQRREYLYKYFPYTESKLMFAINMNSSNLEEIQEFLEKSVKDGCEGLMVKTLDTDAHYEISKRSHNWLKLKKDYLDGVGDTLDLVVIGGYLGTGKRTGVYGGYLLACYDPENEEYQTVCKIGTGFKDDDLQKQFESLSKVKIDKPKSYYRVNDSLEQPDHWFEPEQVWEIKCADFSLSPVHTASIGLIDEGRGISMRFPRYLRTREDKKAEEATSAEQVAEMYKNQQQQLNQNQPKKNSDDEDEE